MSEVKAQLNGLRMAPRKVRAVVNLLKGKNVAEAFSQLEVMVRRPSSPVAKLLKSAIDNAENNYNMVREHLYIKSIRVDEGVKLKRFKPKGFGRVSPLEKKTSRIRVVLAEKVAGLKRPRVGIDRPAAEVDGALSNTLSPSPDSRRPATEVALRSERRDNSLVPSSLRPAAEVEPRRVERQSRTGQRTAQRNGNLGTGMLGRKENVLKSLGKRVFRRKSM